MVDNTQLPQAETIGDVIATDDLGGVKVQRVKLMLGSDGENDGDISASNPIPVTGALTNAQLRADPVAVTDGVLAGYHKPYASAHAGSDRGMAALGNKAGVLDTFSMDASGNVLVAAAALDAISDKLPIAYSAAKGMPDFDVPAAPIRQLPQRVIATSYTTAGSGVDAAQEEIIATGAGMAVNRTGGNLVITSGTTASSETVIRSVASFDGRLTFSFGDTLSQRIVNNNFYREIVDVIGDGLAYHIVNATTLDVTVTAHGFTAANVGQRMDWCALSSVGVPQEVVIASIPSADVIRFTTVGNPASGSGTCSLTGWNKIEFNFTGTSTTVVNINSRRRGYQNTSTAMTISTSASGSLNMCTVQNDRVTFSSGTLAIGTAITDRSVIFTNIPEPDTQFYYQIRAKNGTVAPASTTTWTCGFTRVQDFIATQVELTGMRQFGVGTTMPVSGAVSVSGAVTLATTTVTPAVPATPYILNSAATTNDALIIAGTSGLQAFYATNTGAGAAFVKLYNKATAPTSSDVPAMIIPVPAAVSGVCGVAAPSIGFSGFRFALGLGIRITGAVADNDTTAVAAGQVKVMLSRTV